MENLSDLAGLGVSMFKPAGTQSNPESRIHPRGNAFSAEEVVAVLGNPMDCVRVQASYELPAYGVFEPTKR